jgi:pyruvate dehydrogenase E1 component
LKGIDLLKKPLRWRNKKVAILASGVSVNWALKALERLNDDFKVAAAVLLSHLLE